MSGDVRCVSSLDTETLVSSIIIILSIINIIGDPGDVRDWGRGADQPGAAGPRQGGEL